MRVPDHEVPSALARSIPAATEAAR
jgi:hypothetical protein